MTATITKTKKVKKLAFKLPPMSLGVSSAAMSRNVNDMTHSVSRVLAACGLDPKRFAIVPMEMDDVMRDGATAMGRDIHRIFMSKGAPRFSSGGTAVYKTTTPGIYIVDIHYIMFGSQMARSYLAILDSGCAEETCSNYLEACVAKFKERMETKEALMRKEGAGKLARLILPADLKKDILNEISCFIDAKEDYHSIGLPWKRGMVLYGSPGNGKTTIIRLLAEYFQLRMENLNDRITHAGEVSARPEAYQPTEAKSICPDALTLWDIYNELYPTKHKPTLYYIEDLDKLLPNSTTDSPKVRLGALLNMMDGVDKLDGALFIATTNHVTELAEALMARPGRFDSIYEIAAPKQEQILEMLNLHRITLEGKPPTEIARDLQGYSMAFVEETVKLAKMLHKTTNLTQAQAKGILTKIHDHNNKYKNCFKKCGIGFTEETK